MTQRRELNRAMAARHRGTSMVRTLERLGRNTPGMLELAGGCRLTDLPASTVCEHAQNQSVDKNAPDTQCQTWLTSGQSTSQPLILMMEAAGCK